MSTTAYGVLDTVTQGESWKPRVKLKDSSGAQIDLTATGVTLACRIGLLGASVVTRTSGSAGEYEYETDGTDGDVTFLFAPAVTAAFSVGTYDIEFVYTGTAPTPDDKNVVVRGTISVVAPKTGSI